MNNARISIIAAGVVTALAFASVVKADDKGKDKDKENKVVAEAIVVHFGAPQPQGAPAAVTHLLLPDDVTIKKGQAVNFVVNGGGHGIAIHQVSKNTTRDDIAADLCQGGANEADRLGRSAVCNGTAPTLVDFNGTPAIVIGTNNLNYDITDGKDDLVIHTGFNVNIPATPTTPAIVFNNPRVDDIQHSLRLLATSGASTNDTNNPAAIAGNRAGAFLTGTANPATAGNRINVTFLKTGRYLVICMNRAHSMNDHMFGFVNVVGDDDEN